MKVRCEGGVIYGCALEGRKVYVRVLRHRTLRDLFVAISNNYGRVVSILYRFAFYFCYFFVFLCEGGSFSFPNRPKGNWELTAQGCITFFALLRVLDDVLGVRGWDGPGSRVIANAYGEFFIYVSFCRGALLYYGTYSTGGEGVVVQVGCIIFVVLPTSDGSAVTSVVLKGLYGRAVEMILCSHFLVVDFGRVHGSLSSATSFNSPKGAGYPRVAIRGGASLGGLALRWTYFFSVFIVPPVCNYETLKVLARPSSFELFSEGTVGVLNNTAAMLFGMYTECFLPSFPFAQVLEQHTYTSPEFRRLPASGCFF